MSDKKQKKEIKPADGENDLFEMIKTIAIAVLVAVSVRSFAYEPFSIPSGSMIPTLLVGDYLFVSKYSYGYSKYSLPGGLIDFDGRIKYTAPERGDVAVFKKPNRPSIDYIKRIIGLPGDSVRVAEGRLYINGDPVERNVVGDRSLPEKFGHTVLYREFDETLPGGKVHKIIEKSDNGPLDNTETHEVPAGHFFVMGDNRDGSQDSRVMHDVGFIPVENLVGRAEIIFFSLKNGTRAWQIWKWPTSIRYDRLFQKIK